MFMYQCTVCRPLNLNYMMLLKVLFVRYLGFNFMSMVSISSINVMLSFNFIRWAFAWWVCVACINLYVFVATVLVVKYLR